MNLLPAIRSRGVESEVVALWPPSTLAEDLRAAGFSVHLLELRNRWDPRATLQIARLCRESRFDIIHAHLAASMLYAGLSKPLAPQPKRVVLYHNLFYETPTARNVRHRASKWLLRLVARGLIDAHVAVSRETARHYEGHFGIRSPKVIPAGSIPASEIRGERTRADKRRDEITLITPARLVAEKGHRYLLEALALLRARGVAPKALFIGDGPLRNEIRSQAQSMSLDDAVIFRPSAPHSEVLDLISAADIVVLPSTSEGFPLTALEAMALGTPVVASAVGGLREIVIDGATGRLVEPKNPIALAGAIETIIRSADYRATLAAAGLERVRAEYTSEVIASKWAAFYRALCRTN